jgi:O-antigen/teichoic acid export membrane protein
MLMSNKKQTLIAGALTGSIGILISKALGILYVIPLTNLAGGGINMSFYSTSYTYYDLLKNICSAGIPFAVSSLVAKYYLKKDYKTVLVLRKLATSILLFTGLVFGLLFILISTPLAQYTLEAGKSPEDIKHLSNLFKILSVAVMTVPLLSAMRGYYQGLKQMKAYAFSQVLEQFARVIFLIVAGYVVVVFLQNDNVYAVYMAVAATSIAAIAAIIYYIRFDRKNVGEIIELSKSQKTDAESVKKLTKELLLLGLPFIVTSFLGNSKNIINNMFFINTAVNSSIYSYDQARLALGILQVQAGKLISIPQVLALGFSAGLVPYLTEAYIAKDFKLVRKNILEIINTVMYIGLFLCFMLFVFARPIFYLLYGSADLDLGTNILMFSCIMAMFGIITPITTTVLLTLRLKRKSILNLAIGFIVKVVTFFILVPFIGYIGAIVSSVLCSLVILILNLWNLKSFYSIKYKNVYRNIIIIGISLIAVNGMIFILYSVGLQVSTTNRIINILQLTVYGSLSLIIYLFVSSYFNLPQQIFHIGSIDQIIRKFKKGR